MKRIMIFCYFLLHITTVFSRAVNEKNDFSKTTLIAQELRFVERPECRIDIENYCKHVFSQLQQGEVLNDMAALECLQDVAYNKKMQLQPLCSQSLWKFKIYLTQGPNFARAIMNFCADDAQRISIIKECAANETPGYALNCMIKIERELYENSTCFKFLEKTKRLTISNLQIISPSIKSCSEVINDFMCDAPPIKSVNQQVFSAFTHGVTLKCLIERIWGDGNRQQYQEILKSIPIDCHSQINDIIKLQFSNFRLDSDLFSACRQELKTFCGDKVAGEDVVFNCLFVNKDHSLMNQECSKVLTERAQMVGSDYTLAHSLTNACAKEMEAYRCIPVPGFKKSLHFHLNHVLLCLEYGFYNYYQQDLNKKNFQNNVQIQSSLVPFSTKCQNEMLNYRKLMLNEFRMSPELVSNCAQEIHDHCRQQNDIETGGKTLHCLMSLLKNRNIVTPQCENAIHVVLKVVDIGSNYQVDQILYYSCRPLIEGKCKMDAISYEKTLDCLMNNLGKSDMTESCGQRLVEIMYFMARDWTLDAGLRHACHREAVEICSAKSDWNIESKNSNIKADADLQVLACLYRAGYDVKNPLSENCAQNVRRVLHTRAISVNLLPKIEEACREALVEYCSIDVKPYEELNCLQEHFQKKKFKNKYPKCYDEVYSFTQMETKDTKLNRLLILACKPVIENFCNDFPEIEIDNGDVQQCLIEHKKEPMSPKCKEYINHFELLSLRDYRLNFKFSEACYSDIQEFCSSANQDEGAIIRCLSKVMFEHKILNEGRDLKSKCKDRLKIIHHQQAEVNFDDMKHIYDADPEFLKKCESDIKKLQCMTKKKSTFEDVVECLRTNFEVLDYTCKSFVLIREKIEAIDNTFDENLQKHCKHDINKFCKDEKHETMLICLTDTKNIPLLQEKCLQIVKKRMLEQREDDLLNPVLFTSCKDDALKHCPDEYKKITAVQSNDQQLGGILVLCLRKKFSQFNNPVDLAPKCKEEVLKVILQREFDIRLDKELYKACKSIINLQCSDTILKNEGSYENVLKCLKDHFYNNEISDYNCNKQLTKSIQESLTDIHLDPELHEACTIEIQRICNDVKSGESRIIMCLLNGLEHQKNFFSPLCRTKLSERHRLWNIAHEKNKMPLPQNWKQLYQEIYTHPARNYILMYFVFALVFLLFVGCVCGRMSKKTYMELKNR